MLMIMMLSMSMCPVSPGLRAKCTLFSKVVPPSPPHSFPVSYSFLLFLDIREVEWDFPVVLGTTRATFNGAQEVKSRTLCMPDTPSNPLSYLPDLMIVWFWGFVCYLTRLGKLFGASGNTEHTLREVTYLLDIFASMKRSGFFPLFPFLLQKDLLGYSAFRGNLPALDSVIKNKMFLDEKSPDSDF